MSTEQVGRCRLMLVNITERGKPFKSFFQLCSHVQCSGRWSEVGGQKSESHISRRKEIKEPEKPVGREETRPRPSPLRTLTYNSRPPPPLPWGRVLPAATTCCPASYPPDGCNLEGTDRVKEVYPQVRKKCTHFRFAVVFTDIKKPG